MRFSIFYIALLFLILVIIPITPQQVLLPETIEENGRTMQNEYHDGMYASNASELQFAVYPSKAMSDLNV